jgi:hypothetical protein
MAHDTLAKAGVARLVLKRAFACIALSFGFKI